MMQEVFHKLDIISYSFHVLSFHWSCRFHCQNVHGRWRTPTCVNDAVKDVKVKKVNIQVDCGARKWRRPHWRPTRRQRRHQGCRGIIGASRVETVISRSARICEWRPTWCQRRPIGRLPVLGHFLVQIKDEKEHEKMLEGRLSVIHHINDVS